MKSRFWLAPERNIKLPDNLVPVDESNIVTYIEYKIICFICGRRITEKWKDHVLERAEGWKQDTTTETVVCDTCLVRYGGKNG